MLASFKKFWSRLGNICSSINLFLSKTARQTISSSTGDTLIEVMVAMAVVASVLGAAYTTASRALLISRQSQERTEGLKLVQGQIESLKSIAKTKAAEVFVDKKPFCLDTFLNVVASDNAVCKRGIDGRYKLSIEYDSSKDSRFSVKATWLKLGGSLSTPDDQVEILYKLHPGQS